MHHSWKNTPSATGEMDQHPVSTITTLVFWGGHHSQIQHSRQFGQGKGWPIEAEKENVVEEIHQPEEAAELPQKDSS